MKFRIVAGLALAGAGLLAACGGSGGGSSQSAAPAASTAPSATSAVAVGHTRLGDVLVNADGRTLYGFTNDAGGTSTCNGMCAQTWPAATVAAGWTAGPGTTRSTFHTITRADGSHQLVAGKWPLYTFAGDSAAGDVNGQGTLGKWFVVRADGSLLKSAAAATTPSTVPPTMSGYGY